MHLGSDLSFEQEQKRLHHSYCALWCNWFNLYITQLHPFLLSLLLVYCSFSTFVNIYLLYVHFATVCGIWLDTKLYFIELVLTVSGDNTVRFNLIDAFIILLYR